MISYIVGKTLLLIIFLNLFFIIILDFFVGHFIEKPHIFLNTSGEYSSNHRNYFVKKTDTQGNTSFVVDRSSPIDLHYENHKFSKNDYKVFAIGDSFTSGQGVKEKDTWVKQIETSLKNKKIWGLNYGYQGANIEKIFTIFNSNIQKVSPQLTVYAFVLNDAKEAFSSPASTLTRDKENYSPYYDFINLRTMNFEKNRTPFLNFLYKHSYTFQYIIRSLEIRKVSESTTQFYNDLYDPKINPRGLEFTLEKILQMKESASKNNSSFLVMIFPLFYKTQKDYPFKNVHQTLTKMLAERNIKTLDLLPVYEGIPDKELWVHPIDQHPNDYAHSLAAKALINWLKEHEL